MTSSNLRNVQHRVGLSVFALGAMHVTVPHRMTSYLERLFSQILVSSLDNRCAPLELLAEREGSLWDHWGAWQSWHAVVKVGDVSFREPMKIESHFLN